MGGIFLKTNPTVLDRFDSPLGGHRLSRIQCIAQRSPRVTGVGGAAELQPADNDKEWGTRLTSDGVGI